MVGYGYGVDGLRVEYGMGWFRVILQDDPNLVFGIRFVLGGIRSSCGMTQI